MVLTVCMVLMVLTLRVKRFLCMKRPMSKKPAPEAPAKEPKFVRLQLMVDADFGEKVDRWRAKQPGLPNRSAAVRMLVDMALQNSQRAQLN